MTAFQTTRDMLRRAVLSKQHNGACAMTRETTCYVIILTTSLRRALDARGNDPSTCLVDAVSGAGPDRPDP